MFFAVEGHMVRPEENAGVVIQDRWRAGWGYERISRRRGLVQIEGLYTQRKDETCAEVRHVKVLARRVKDASYDTKRRRRVRINVQYLLLRKLLAPILLLFS